MMENTSRGMGMLWGIILIILGLFMIALPLVALGAAAIVLGLIIIFRSLSIMAGPARLGSGSRAGIYILGIIGLILGILIFISPFVSIVAVALLMGVALVIVGLGDLIHVFAPTTMNRWVSLIVAILSFIFAAALFTAPVIASAVIIQAVGIYAIVVGFLDIIFGFMYRPRMMTRPHAATRIG